VTFVPFDVRKFRAPKMPSPYVLTMMAGLRLFAF